MYIRFFIGIILLLSGIFFTMVPTHASIASDIANIGAISQSASITFYTTEKIPGLQCSGGGGSFNTSRRYRCTCNSATCFADMLKSFYNTTFFITLLASTLMLVIAGIGISLSGVNSEFKSNAKAWIMRIIGGIIVLSLIPLILTSIAPWVFR